MVPVIGDIVDGGGDEVEVVDEHRCGEDEVEFNRAAGEGVVGVRGKHVHALLLGKLDVRTFGLCVLEEAEVCVGTASRVVAVGGNRVAAGLQEVLQVVVEVEHNAVAPCLACIGNLDAVHIELEHIVVAVLQVEVFVEVSITEFDVATDVDVGTSLTSPAAANVLAFAAPSGLFCLP